MTEGLFILTTLFVAYVIYVIINEKKGVGTADKKSAPAAAQTIKATVEEKPKTEAAKSKPAPAKKAPAKVAVVKAAPVPKAVAAAKPVSAKKPVAAKKPAEVAAPAPEPATIKGTGLKDPKTGEVATTYGNYRFTKRWIKEALVSEKLVDKVYKNDELNADVETKIKAGLAKLEGMKKYKP